MNHWLYLYWVKKVPMEEQRMKKMTMMTMMMWLVGMERHPHRNHRIVHEPIGQMMMTFDHARLLKQPLLMPSYPSSHQWLTLIHRLGRRMRYKVEDRRWWSHPLMKMSMMTMMMEIMTSWIIHPKPREIRQVVPYEYHHVHPMLMMMTMMKEEQQWSTEMMMVKKIKKTMTGMKKKQINHHQFRVNPMMTLMTMSGMNEKRLN
jgi:hypothetical protein